MSATLVSAAWPEITLRGEMRCAEPMAAHVSWRAGGAVARAYIPADRDDLVSFMRVLRRDEPLLFVGLGSNLLVRDGGFDGTVILTHKGLNRLEATAPDEIYAEAGVPSPKLARLAASLDLSGVEFLAGIPGTVGGALAMNAGCNGGETWPLVRRVLTIDREGQLHERTAEDFAVAYRHVGLRTITDEWFVGAWFGLQPGQGDHVRETMRAWLDRRAATQPLQLPNAGSVFRNPPGDHAGRLIEAAGLKGLRIGGAQVSEKHANFIVNVGGASHAQATAEDIETLIEAVQETVYEQFGVRLIREVRIVGEHA